MAAADGRGLRSEKSAAVLIGEKERCFVAGARLGGVEGEASRV